MELPTLQKIDVWPKLSWVARFTLGSERIVVCHGPMVELETIHTSSTSPIQHRIKNGGDTP
jgi:hypothetical protein